MKTSEQTDKLLPALITAIGEIKNPTIDATNPHFKSKYATLVSVIEATKPALAKNNLIAHHGTRVEDGRLILSTRITHASGQFVESDYPIEPIKRDPQGFGSAITYARRYTLAAMLGVFQDDDDGNGASEPIAPRKNYATTPNPTLPAQAPRNGQSNAQAPRHPRYQAIEDARRVNGWENQDIQRVMKEMFKADKLIDLDDVRFDALVKLVKDHKPFDVLSELTTNEEKIK